MKVFITGGSGFVGRRLIRVLAQERGATVRALARSAAAAEIVRAEGAEPVEGDLESDGALRAGVSGAEVVFHAAAKVDVWGRREDFERITIDGTRRVLAAARAAGVARFVHVSTEAVLVGGPALVNADETWPLPARPLGLYPWSKGRAEEEVRAAASQGLHAVIVRPRAIWGAGDTVLLPRLKELVEQKRFSWIAGGRYLTSTCHVRNVCEGLLCAASRGVRGETYFVTDGPPIEFRAWVSGLLVAVGVQAPTRSVPRWIARAAAWLTERVVSVDAQPTITRTSVRLMGEEVTVSDAKARRELGYAPPIAREQGLEELARSARQYL